MYIHVSPNRTWILPCCLMFLNNQLHTMVIHTTCTTTVLCCTGSFHFFADTLCIQNSYFFWYYHRFCCCIYIYILMGYLFVCPFLSLMRTICSVKLIIFPSLCLKNVYRGFWFVPDNVWQIKSENLLTLHSWIVVAPLFIEFKYRRWKLTTHMPTIVGRSQNQHFFVGQHFSRFRFFYVACYAHQ